MEGAGSCEEGEASAPSRCGNGRNLLLRMLRPYARPLCEEMQDPFRTEWPWRCGAALRDHWHSARLPPI